MWTTAHVRNVILLGDHWWPILCWCAIKQLLTHYDVSHVNTATMLRAKWATAHCYIDVSSASMVLGPTFSWFLTSARTKLLSNNCQVRFFQKLWNVNEKWQRYCQKTTIFLTVKNMTELAIKILWGCAVIQNTLGGLIIHQLLEVMYICQKLCWCTSNVWTKTKWDTV